MSGAHLDPHDALLVTHEEQVGGLDTAQAALLQEI